MDGYFSVLPGPTLLDWREFDPDPRPEEVQLAASLLRKVSSLDEAVALDFEGVAIGRHALSWLMRQQRLGTIEIARHRDALTAHLASSLAAIRAAKSCLARTDVKAILMNERGYSPFGEFFDVALLQRRRVVQYVASHRDDARVYKAYSIDSRTEHPYSLSERSWSQLSGERPLNEEEQRNLLAKWANLYRAKEWFNFQRLLHKTSTHDKSLVHTMLGLDPEKKTAVVYAHIFWDATFFYGESLYADYCQWFLDTVRHANLNPRLNWILKLHPVNVWRSEADGTAPECSELAALAEAQLDLGDHVKLVMPETELSAWSIYESADYCLTVRGTVGIENAALGKRVIVAGTGHYSGYGFTTNPTSLEEYRQLLATLHTLSPLSSSERRRALLFAHAFLERKPFSLSSFRMRYQSGSTFHPLNGDPEILASTVDSFFEAPSAERWARWLTESDDADLLEDRTVS